MCASGKINELDSSVRDELSRWQLRLLGSLRDEGSALKNIFFLSDDEEVKRFILNYLGFFDADQLLDIRGKSVERSLLMDYYWLTDELDPIAGMANCQIKDLGTFIKACWRTGKRIPGIGGFVARNWPQVSMSVSLCATVLFYAEKYGYELGRIKRMSMDQESGTGDVGEVKIAAVAMIKEPPEVAGPFVEYLRALGDMVVVSDGNLGKHGCDLDDAFPDVIFLEQEAFHETKIKTALWDACRRNGATHILMLDSDERLDPAITVEQLRRYAEICPPGTVLSVPWVQSFGEDSMINFDILEKSSYARNLPPYKDLMCADDGRSQHVNLTLHTPIANRPGTRFICDDLSIVHLEGSVVGNLVVKLNQYWRRDFNMNGNLPLCYQRYLPRTLRLLLLQKRPGETVSSSGAVQSHIDTIRLLSNAAVMDDNGSVPKTRYHPKISPFTWVPLK